MSAPELIARCFAARTAAHFAHLKTTSYAQHKALEEFYEGIVDATDAFAECYQGLFGVIADYPPAPLPSGDPQTWVIELNKWVRQNREACSQGKTELGNLIDEILALTDRTYYKLHNLK